MSNNLIIPISVQALAIGQADVTNNQSLITKANSLESMAYLDGGNNVQPPRPNSPQYRGDPYISDAYFPKAFDDMPMQRIDNPAVRLHWSLPSYFRQSKKQIARNSEGKPPTDLQLNDQASFPDAPDRWLVTRFFIDNSDPENPKTVQKCWVVDSSLIVSIPFGQPDTGPTSPIVLSQDHLTVPFYAPGMKPYAFLGKIFALADYDATGVHADHLTALGYSSEIQLEKNNTPTTVTVGYQDIEFASFYANCKNIFAMEDDLSDLLQEFSGNKKYDPKTMSLSYSVAGWFDDVKKDPVYQTLPVLSPAGNTVQQFTIPNTNWAFTLAENSAEPFDQSFYSGYVLQVNFDPSAAYLNPTASKDIEFAIGNSATEALSAFLATKIDGNSSPNGLPFEDELNALQMGKLAELSEINGPQQYEENLHRASFKRLHGGSQYVVQATGQSDPSKITPPLPKDIAELLASLNETQRQFDTQSKELQTARWLLYADYCKYLLFTYQDPNAPISLPNEPENFDLYSYLQSEISYVQKCDSALNTLQQTRNQTAEKLAGLITANLRDSTLQVIPAGRYFEPKEPVILMSGSDVTPRTHFSEGSTAHERNQILSCRTVSQITNAVEIVAGAFGNAAAVSVAAQQILALENSNLPDSSVLVQLSTEGFFSDNKAASAIAQLIAAQDGQNSPLKNQIPGISDALVSAQNDFLKQTSEQPSSAKILFTTTTANSASAATSFAYAMWDQPWLPIIMHWNAEFVPSVFIPNENTVSYSPQYFIENFQLNTDHVDFQAANSPNQQTYEAYDGIISLSPHATTSLASAIQKFQNGVSPDLEQKLAQLSGQLKGTNFLAQSLGGFNMGLLMHKEMMQFDVKDPLQVSTDPDIFKTINEDAPQAIDGQNTTFPLDENCYNPMRAGQLQLQRIRLVDVFGQYKDILNDSQDSNPPPIFRAKSLIPAQQLSPRFIELPPRITQPARLDFRYSPADSSAPENQNPICGWLLFNHLNNNLVIFDQAGNALVLVYANGQIISAPGGEPTLTGAAAIKALIQNPTVQSFAMSLTTMTGDNLQGFFKTIDTICSTILPKGAEQNVSTAVFMGRPLAILNVSLKLETLGVYAPNVSWQALFNDYNNTNDYNPERTENGFTNIEFPLFIGNPSSIDDGLVGYYNQANPDPFSEFHEPTILDSQNSLSLTISTITKEDKINLTLIIDPRAPVHVTTGILPVKTMSIPQAYYALALDNMSVTFLTSPILSPDGKIEMPIPAEFSKEWSWIQMQNGQWSKSKDISNSDANAGIRSNKYSLQEGWLKISPSKTSGE